MNQNKLYEICEKLSGYKLIHKHTRTNQYQL